MYSTRIPPAWVNLFNSTASQTQDGDWIGLFRDDILELPTAIIRATQTFTPRLSSAQTFIDIPTDTPIYQAGDTSRILRPYSGIILGNHRFAGSVRKVRVISSPARTSCPSSLVHRYLAPLSCLVFDPGRWHWRPGEGLYMYTAKLGRKWRNPREVLSLSIEDKWAAHGIRNLEPNWSEIWMQARPRKDAAFLWSLSHKAIAVNQWRNQSHPPTSALCTCCNHNEAETILHCFFECGAAQKAWDIGFSILYHAGKVPVDGVSWTRLTWTQCLIGGQLPVHLE